MVRVRVRVVVRVVVAFSVWPRFIVGTGEVAGAREEFIVGPERGSGRPGGICSRTRER
jgi:hypothetical protein